MKKLNQIVDHSKNSIDAIIMIAYKKTNNNKFSIILENFSENKNKPKKMYKKMAVTKKKQIPSLKITYLILFFFVLFLLILSITNLLVVNGITIFLLCLLSILPLFPYVKKIKLPGIELETSMNDKE